MTVPDPDWAGMVRPGGGEAAGGQREGDGGASGASLAHRDGRGVTVGRGGDSGGQRAYAAVQRPPLAAVHSR